MFTSFQLTKKYLHYYLSASNGKGHGIHSPFVFDFIKNVLNNRAAYPDYLPIEQKRKDLLPYAFTEHGITMLASVLRSSTAIKMNIAIIRAFIALRKFAIH